MMFDIPVEIQGMLIGGSVDDLHLIVRVIEESGVAHFSLDHTPDGVFRDISLGIKTHHIYFVQHKYETEPEQLGLIERIRATNPVAEIILVIENEDEEVLKRAQTAGCDDCLHKSHLQRNPLRRLVERAKRKIAALEEVTKLNQKFSLIEKAADAGTWEWDLRKNCSTWSEQQYRLFGVNPVGNEIVRYDTWRSIIHPEDVDLVEANLGRAIVGQAIFDTEFRVIYPNNAVQNGGPAIRWLRGMGHVQRDASGAAVTMTGINFDITAQKASLLALQDQFAVASKAQKRTTNIFHAHFDNSPDCMFQIGIAEGGRLVYEAINPSGLEHGGQKLENMLGKTPEEMLGPEVGGAIMHGLRTVCETRQPYYYQPSFDMATGPVIYDAVYTPVFDENGELDSILGCARDITLLRRTQSTLYQAQKMEAIGQLASGIAHDFNNVLNTLYTCTQLLGTQVASELGGKLLKSAHKAVEQGEELSSRLVNFARPKNIAIAATDVNKSITDMTEMLSHTLGSNIRLETTLAANLWLAKADFNQLEIAILNLAINSRDAMSNGGLLSITTRNVDASLGQDNGYTELVEISIVDTGCGMSEEVTAKATTAFFTTKPIGKGTGLGLSMVAETIRSMNGNIKIQSELGVGTNIVLTLPKFDSLSTID
jgi:signal transduction histidine kinase/PAS domain-containing protein